MKTTRPFRESAQLSLWLALVAVLFTAWGLNIIFRSSFVAVDGRRCFCLFDDAMICMRYAWNLLHGHGLVWNPGERVEGVTTLLLTFTMALWQLLLPKNLASLGVQLSGLGFLLGIAVLTFKIGSRWFASAQEPARTVLLALCFLTGLVYYPLDYWSIMGMETGLLTILLVAALHFLIENEKRVRVSWEWALCAGLERAPI